MEIIHVEMASKYRVLCMEKWQKNLGGMDATDRRNVVSCVTPRRRRKAVKKTTMKALRKKALRKR